MGKEDKSPVYSRDVMELGIIEYYCPIKKRSLCNMIAAQALFYIFPTPTSEAYVRADVRSKRMRDSHSM
ncbi:MAG: hypothetical protein J6T38_02190 [Bacteroidaceae bacterium]|nr:hypothetical protein [Bacteroidaceae bacterium]